MPRCAGWRSPRCCLLWAALAAAQMPPQAGPEGYVPGLRHARFQVSELGGDHRLQGRSRAPLRRRQGHVQVLVRSRQVRERPQARGHGDALGHRLLQPAADRRDARRSTSSAPMSSARWATNSCRWRRRRMPKSSCASTRASGSFASTRWRRICLNGWTAANSRAARAAPVAGGVAALAAAVNPRRIARHDAPSQTPRTIAASCRCRLGRLGHLHR